MTQFSEDTCPRCKTSSQEHQKVIQRLCTIVKWFSNALLDDNVPSRIVNTAVNAAKGKPSPVSIATIQHKGGDGYSSSQLDYTGHLEALLQGLYFFVDEAMSELDTPTPNGLVLSVLRRWYVNKTIVISPRHDRINGC